MGIKTIAKTGSSYTLKSADNNKHPEDQLCWSGGTLLREGVGSRRGNRRFPTRVIFDPLVLAPTYFGAR